MENTKNSRAKIDAIRRYEAKTYDRINVRLPKGVKDIIKATGQSVNAYIVSAVREKIERES